MKFIFSTAFTLLFIGIYKKYTPICYIYLSRTVLKGKLKVIKNAYFSFNRKSEIKTNIYKKNSFCLLNNRFHPFDFLTVNQGKELLGFATTNGYKSIVFFYIHLTDIFFCQSSFLI
jgi:hypothetical protein